MSEQLNNFKLIGDMPIYENESTDQLNFEHTSKVLSGAALQTKDPITIGVFGNWGSGKTSLMRLMQKDINDKKTNKHLSVWFNAWQYEREEHLIIPLIKTILTNMENKKIETGRISDIGKILKSALSGLSLKIPNIGLNVSPKDMVAFYQNLNKGIFDDPGLYFNAFKTLNSLSERSDDDSKIVVFIDDLDRCFPEKAVHLLENIKLILNQPGFSFVLGVYPEIIHGFIRNKYATQYAVDTIKMISDGSNTEKNKLTNYLDYFTDYLDKIVQIQHYVPIREPDKMGNYIASLLEKADIKEEFIKDINESSYIFEAIAELGDRNPRKIVRKINRLIVQWRLSSQEGHQSFDLPYSLINEMFLDRQKQGYKGNNSSKYDQFLHLIGEVDKNDKSQNITYGEYLVQMLKKDSDLRDIDTAKENMSTIKTLVEIFKEEDGQKCDEPLLNVLNTSFGRKWLSNKDIRDGVSQINKDQTDMINKLYSEGELDEDISQSKIGASHLIHRPLKDSDNILEWLNMIKIPISEEGFERGNKEDKTLHTVKLSKFLMMKTAVTQLQYQSVMGGNPSQFKGDGHPVERVNFLDALSFCEQITNKTEGYVFRLPTDAEWEYACRAGTTTPFNTGKNLTTDQANYNGNHPYKDFPKGKFIGKTVPVGSYAPNSWGLFDMHGNVWEWCSDWGSGARKFKN